MPDAQQWRILMKGLQKREILKNVGSSWFALGTNVAVGVFLSPYILHRLGDEAFGLWVLIFSVTGCYGLVDLGIRSSIIRYVARYSATDDRENLNRLINTAMFSYGGIGALALLVTLIASFYVNSIFGIPDEGKMIINGRFWVTAEANGASGSHGTKGTLFWGDHQWPVLR